ncbi:TM2 domain-containing protein [Balneolales bacterium ANBcel1]|nr:TM2 domain-containing protein [Balneolales bacterium ANBcel1]
MNEQKVDMFIMSNSKYFEPYHLETLRQNLLKAEESRFNRIQVTSFKDPTLALVVSLLGGPLGIDRFYIGDVGLGIAKLLTCGGLGIWTFVDYFLIMGRTREANFEKYQELIYF